MAIEQIEVLCVWVDENDKQVGARLSFNQQNTQIVDVSLNELHAYRGRLHNAEVTVYGLRGKAGITLIRKPLIRKTGQRVATYTLMHADVEVCKIYTEQNKVEILSGVHLPFALTGKNITVLDFERWLNRRVDNLARTYMNKVYIARKIGRDRERILRDSCAVSIIDNFWVRRSDVDTTWSELKMKRDKNLVLSNIALTGEIDTRQFESALEGTTSLFTIKGCYKKAVLNGYILKKDDNAEYEFAVYTLGKVLGVSVVQAEKRGQGIIACRIFTTETVSMVHAIDLLHLTDYNGSVEEDWHRAIYQYFINEKRQEIAQQLERLYIFNYIVLNVDLHDENFGFLYDTETFNIFSVAPAYDFNSAFRSQGYTSADMQWIRSKLPQFINNHKDIKQRLSSKEVYNVLSHLKDLSKEQKQRVWENIEYLKKI